MLKTAMERDQLARPFEQSIKQFGEVVMNDQSLLARLDQAPDKESFIQLYRSLAADRDIHFTRDDLLVAVQEQKQGSNWVIPRAVLLMIADRF
ncbi:MAG TPA: hypothetical protein PLQ95_03205 [Thiobacillus sp.]|nr:hypothetical protein [Thiobacillus sp.]